MASMQNQPCSGEGIGKIGSSHVGNKHALSLLNLSSSFNYHAALVIAFLQTLWLCIEMQSTPLQLYTIETMHMKITHSNLICIDKLLLPL